MDALAYLSRSHLCSGLNKKELEAIAAVVVFRTVGKDEILFFEGDPASGFYVLLTGKIRIYKSSPDGKEYTLHLIGPGQIFAEAAIFRDDIFPANGMAVEDSFVAFFSKNAFLTLLKNSPELSLKIIGSLSAFVRDFNRQVEELSLKEVPARVASFLLSQSEEKKSNIIHLDTSKSELANRLGTIRETLSRNLKKLIDSGIIEVDGKKITILDSARLIAIADGEKF